MAKDLKIDVVTDSDPKGLLSTAAEIDRLADKTDKLGHDFDKTAVEGAFLARELEAVKLKSAELAKQFDEGGDKAILRQLSRNQAYERQLQKVGKELDNVGESAGHEAEKLGKDLAKDTESGFKKFLSGGGGSGGGIMDLLLTPQGLAAAAVAASAAGVMIGGAVVTGIGLAGIGAGIAIALKDPRVQAAEQGLKSDISKSLKDAASPFVSPLISALHQVDTLVKSEIAPGLKGMFSQLAPEIGIVTQGLGKFISSVVTGFEHAAVAAKPLLDELGSQLLPRLGQEVLVLFNTIADHAPEAEQGLKALFALIGAGIATVDGAIKVFSAIWDNMVQNFEGGVLIADKVVGALLAVAKALHLPSVGDLTKAKESMDGFLVTTDKFRTGADNLHGGFALASIAAGGYAQAASHAAEKTKELLTAWDALTKNISNDSAINQALDAIAGITDQIDKSSHSLDQNTAKGRANREALEGQITTLAQQRDQLIKNGMSASDAGKLFDGWVKKLEAAAEKAGISKTAVQALNKQLGLLPKSKTINIVMDTKHYDEFLTGPPQTNYHGHAAGGRFLAGDMMLVGEHRPEMVQFDRPGTVIPSVPSVMPGSSGGGGGIHVDVHLHGISAVKQVQAYVREQYAGNVTAALQGHA